MSPWKSLQAQKKCPAIKKWKFQVQHKNNSRFGLSDKENHRYFIRMIWLKWKCWVARQVIKTRNIWIHHRINMREIISHMQHLWSSRRVILIYCWIFTIALSKILKYVPTIKMRCPNSCRGYASCSTLEYFYGLRVAEVCRQTEAGRGSAPCPHSAISFHRRVFG